MSYQRLDNYGLIRSELAESIELEEAISDTLIDGFTGSAPPLLSLYAEMKNTYCLLNETEKLILRGVGLKLWQLREMARAGPILTQELTQARLDNQAYQFRINQLLTEDELNVANDIIDGLQLPEPIALST